MERLHVEHNLLTLSKQVKWEGNTFQIGVANITFKEQLINT